MKIDATAHLTRENVEALLIEAMKVRMPQFNAKKVTFNVSNGVVVGADVDMEPAPSTSSYYER